MMRVRSRYELLVALLTARPDRATEAGRSMSRYRAMAMTFLASFLAKGIGIAVTLISVPLTLSYLGTERFGMWMVLSSFALLLSLTDLGVGNSVLTAVAKTSGERDTSQLRRQIASAYAVTGAIAALLLAIFATIYSYVQWSSLFNVSGAQAMAEAGPASAVFFAILTVATPLNLINRIQLGLQLGFRASLWQAAGGVMALGAIYLAIRLEASLPWLVASQSGVPALVALVNAAHFFRRTRPDLRPVPRLCDREAMRKLWSGGLLFLVLQVCAAVMFQSNVIVVAQVMNSEAVATFAIADRLFGLIAFAVGLMLMPLWPAYGEALASRDTPWIRRTFRRSLLVSIAVSATMSALMLLLGPILIRWWVGDAIIVPFGVLLGFAVWKVMEAIGNAVAMLLNGLNEIRSQAILAVFNATANVILKIWLVGILGLPGVMLATIIAYSVFALPWLVWLVRTALRQIAERN